MLPQILSCLFHIVCLRQFIMLLSQLEENQFTQTYFNSNIHIHVHMYGHTLNITKPSKHTDTIKHSNNRFMLVFTKYKLIHVFLITANWDNRRHNYHKQKKKKMFQLKPWNIFKDPLCSLTKHLFIHIIPYEHSHTANVNIKSLVLHTQF